MSSGANVMTPDEFLEFVFGDLDDDETICVAKGSPKQNGDTVFWNLAPDHKVFTGWKRRPERMRQAWYFCVSATRGTLNEKGNALRRRRKDLTRYHCLVLDDIGTKAEAPPVDPAWKLESSAGNYQWGYLLEPGDKFGSYEALLEWAHEQGWGDGGAGGSYRLMRIPGSANLKEGKDRFISRVEVVDDTVWQLADLARELGVSSEQWSSMASRTIERAKMNGTRVTKIANAINDPVLTWLTENNHVISDSGQEFVEVACPWGDQHTTGSNVASYSPLGRGSGSHAERRGFNCFHEHCRERGFREYNDWVVEQGGPWAAGVDPLPFLQQQYVYVENGCKWADMNQRPQGGWWILEDREFGGRHKRKVDAPGHDRPVQVSTAMLESDDTRRAARITYWPGRDDTFEMDVQNHINAYVEATWPETDEEPTVFLDHIDYLLPNDIEYDLFLDWLAWKVQNPGRRSYAMLMIAEDAFGTGRSWLGKALSAALKGHVNHATFKQLIGRGTSGENTYNDWAAECQFLIINEAKDVTREDFFDSYETFKDRISNDPSTFWRNTKYGAARNDFMWFNALIFSNHGDALVIPEEDRRVCVLTNPTQMEKNDYYERLHRSLEADEPQKIFWYLKTRDVSKFDHVYPPMTPGKMSMIETTSSPIERITDYVKETTEHDLVTRDTLAHEIRRAAADLSLSDLYRGSDLDKAVRNIWPKLHNLRPGTKNGARYSINNKQTEVRAVRNREHWLAIDAARDTKTITKQFDTRQRTPI